MGGKAASGGGDRLSAALRPGKWVVVAIWAVLVILAGPWSSRLDQVTSRDQTVSLPPAAQSTRVTALEAAQSGGGASDAAVVYVRPSGLTGADRQRIDRDRQAVAGDDSAATGRPQPVVSAPDGSAAVFAVPIRSGQEEAGIVMLRRLVDSGTAGGLSVAVTGPAGVRADFGHALEGVDTRLLYATIAVVVVLLVLTYRSPVLWIVPLAGVYAALRLSHAAVYLFERSGGTVTKLGTAILTVLVFGCGTDYALLLAARYREELRRQADRHDAMARALRRTYGALAASAGTVIVGMLCLIMASLGETRGLGPTLALGVAWALLVMLTLLPALLLIGGRWLFWPLVPHAGDTDTAAGGGWARIAAVVSRRPRLAAGITFGVLLLMVGGLATTRLDLNPLNQFANAPESVTGQRLLAAHFPIGLSTRTVVLAPQADAGQVRRVLASAPLVAAVESTPPVGGLAAFDVVLNADPYSGPALDAVSSLRERLASVSRDVLVGGPTAAQLDRRTATARDDRVVAPLILLAILVVLGLLLRSVVAAVALTASVVFSFAAAMGISMVVYRWFFGFAGISPEIPLYAFLFLVALGVDYTIFLMHRARQEASVAGTETGMQYGLAVTGGVITSAGLVLAGTFAVLAILPVVQFAEVGFAVSFGVLLDTFVVRSLLVPALVQLIGARVWWPSRPAPPMAGERVPAGEPDVIRQR